MVRCCPLINAIDRPSSDCHTPNMRVWTGSSAKVRSRRSVNATFRTGDLSLYRSSAGNPSRGERLPLSRLDPNWPTSTRDYLLAHLPARTPNTEAELGLAHDVQSLIDFELLVPASLPFGHRLSGSDQIPYCRTLATLLFTQGSYRQFRLSQRTTTNSLAFELSAVQLPHAFITVADRQVAIIYGSYATGEPLYWQWHKSRRTLAWEERGRVCDLDLVIRNGPSLPLCLRVIASMMPLTEIRPAHG